MDGLPASQCRHLHHGMSKSNLLKAVLKDCVYSWGVFLFSLHHVTELGGCIHPQTLEDTLKQTHLVLKWGGIPWLPGPDFSVSFLASSNNTCQLTNMTLHSWISQAAFLSPQRTPFSLVPDSPLHLDIPTDTVAGQSTVSFLPLHIRESPRPFAKQPNPRPALGP